MAAESTGPSAATLGGIALIGLGLLAGVFGVATMTSGDQENSAQTRPAPPVTTAPAPPSPTSSAPTTSKATSAAPVPPPAPKPTQEVPKPPPAASEPGPGSNENGLAYIQVRVYNNSTIKGLANRAAEDIKRVGYSVAEVGNYSAGRIYTTTVYYRPGTDEESQARMIAKDFGARLEPRFEGIENAAPGVIAIVTNDYKGYVGGK